MKKKTLLMAGLACVMAAVSASYPNKTEKWGIDSKLVAAYIQPIG